MNVSKPSVNKTKIMLYCALCVVVNIVLGMFNIPFVFMDTVGTIFAAACFGPLAGASVGLVTNLVLGALKGLPEVFFAIVNIIVGLIIGVFTRKFGFGLIAAIIAGIILTVVASFVGSFIAQFVYGGVTGTSIDVIFTALRASGQNVFEAIFTTRIIANIADKVISCVLVSVVLKLLPKNLFRGIVLNYAQNK